MLRTVLLNCAIDGASLYPSYRKPFDLIFQQKKMKNGQVIGNIVEIVSGRVWRSNPSRLLPRSPALTARGMFVTVPRIARVRST